jgi:hypothetical protein
LVKNQSKAQGLAHQKQLISKFFYPFSLNDLVKTAPPKQAQFSHQTRMFALLIGGMYSKYYEKKQ